MVRPDANAPHTDGPAAAAAATGCFLSWWWLLAALLLIMLAWWMTVPWWRARYAPGEPAEPAPIERPLTE